MAKSIFILGCGIMQIPALRLAKQQGWHTAAADGNPQAPGRSYCDEFFPIDLKDTDALIAAAKTSTSGRGPDGVFTAGTDFSLSTAIIAEALGLPGHSVEAARRATDKTLMRQSFQAAGVPSPPFAELSAGQSIPNTVPGPWVVKPVDSMGARGVVRIDSRAELDAALAEARAFSRSKRALIESCMEGPEFSLDALVMGDKIIRCGLADRHIAYPPRFIETGHTIPSNADAETAEALWELFAQGIRALGLHWGAAKGDVKLTPQGPMIGEIAARLSGGYMSGWTQPAASGTEPTLGAIRLALGLDPGDLLPNRNLVCAERALIAIDGTVKQIDGATLPGVIEIFLRCRSGDKVRFPRNNVEKAGNVLAVGASHSEAQARAQAALRALRLELNPADADTGTYLDASDAFPPNVFPTGEFFARLWQSHPPHPSRGCPIKNPSIAIPANLPEHRDNAGRTMRDIILLLQNEGRLRVLMDAGTDTNNNGTLGNITPEQMRSDFWKALVRGGMEGLRWYLDRGGALE
ncbi:MAG: hypothetical protein B0D92_04870 [Spirochaeta sp. LUC14_002_19_P3]|nr:MAG: hypothetical protein B0D92_04870 [Spirochaeta sp. LUC14_002_19_P3]